ncbi:NAD-dependent protein deacetylase [Nonomuraea turcica]|uniref:NAD-dependent protein deacetylase n=1 Tax=Nonomuraea sp. G32 TaxID=3067274 RepID=UPI00273AC2F6|nr:NAD-dependent protein deacetylase [Nonomuraea sp. G32]MDP4507749.1 NAD-dependent protein deacetylase [Nonomuraea sp. G32]
MTPSTTKSPLADQVEAAEPSDPRQASDIALLAELVGQGSVAVLSGAGISTESGIPDYRGPTGQARRAEPMTYQRFVGSAEARRRYWARSHVGWQQIGQARPNAGHRAVAALERHGLLSGIITQNVDSLHQAAGARRVIELHGGLDRVVCLSCRERTSRSDLDRRLREANPHWHAIGHQINPDGDAVLTDGQVEGFEVVDCTGCGGLLKPDVIFFGENVPRARVDECFGMVARARVLLVLGSSLAIKSGLRFVTKAAALGLPIAIVNQGPTGGDADATLTLDAPLGTTLTDLATQLGAQ